MRLSIIVPTLNEAAVVKDLLADLASAHAAGHELIVVDGGSQDRTVEFVHPFVDCVLSSPPGRAVQMNAGAAAAKGDALWFVHADCRIPADAVTAITRELKHGRRWGRFDIRLSGQAWPFRVIERMMNLRSCVIGIATGDQGIFVSRELFDAVGGYPSIALMEDIALSNLLRREYRPLCIKKPRLQTSSRRWEERGILRTIWLMWRLRLAYALGKSPDELARRYS